MTENWRDSAVCAQTDPDLFHPDKGEFQHVTRVLCGGCPVKAECLEYAMGFEGDACKSGRFGIWGGLTPVQRAKLAKLRRDKNKGDVREVAVPRDRGRPGTDPVVVDRIMALRAQGKGYDLIATELQMPRSTVANICQRKAAAA